MLFTSFGDHSSAESITQCLKIVISHAFTSCIDFYILRTRLVALLSHCLKNWIFGIRRNTAPNVTEWKRNIGMNVYRLIISYKGKKFYHMDSTLLLMYLLIKEKGCLGQGWKSQGERGLLAGEEQDCFFKMGKIHT